MIQLIFTILPVAVGDKNISIQTNKPHPLLTYLSFELNYSILASSVKSNVVFRVSGNFDAVPQVAQFVPKSGQTIKIEVLANNSTTRQTFYYGYIREVFFSRDITMGTVMTLSLDQILGQLTTLGSNSDWNDTLYRYNTLMSGVTGNTVDLSTLLSAVAEGSLISGLPNNFDGPLQNNYFTIIDGQAPPMPSQVFATALPNKTRDTILREVLFTYSRILYQSQDGKVIIRPLFSNDIANDIWSIDIAQNDTKVWLRWFFHESSANMVNRLDFQFGALLPFDRLNNPTIYDKIGNNTFCSTTADATYYRRMTDLYNSGKFTNAILQSKSLDQSLLLDSALYNSFLSTAGNFDSTNAKIYASILPEGKRTVPQIYGLNEMAINTISAYGVQIEYDFYKMVQLGQFINLPLGQLVQVNTYNILDYSSLLCYNCKITSNTQTGTNAMLSLCPIKSVTGIWYTK